SIGCGKTRTYCTVKRSMKVASSAVAISGSLRRVGGWEGRGDMGAVGPDQLEPAFARPQLPVDLHPLLLLLLRDVGHSGRRHRPLLHEGAELGRRQSRTDRHAVEEVGERIKHLMPAAEESRPPGRAGSARQIATVVPGRLATGCD